jgi:CubicO group peptidase (beta-lactamase class C family)
MTTLEATYGPDAVPMGGLRLERSRLVAAVVIAAVVGGWAVLHGSNSGGTLIKDPNFITPTQSASAGPQVLGDPCDIWNNPEAVKVLKESVTNTADQTILRTRAAPGGEVTVGCGDKMLINIGVGKTGIGNTRVTPETKYDPASITKMFTTTGILMLAQEGKLKLNQPIGDFLPEYRKGAKAKVTFRMELQHRSGLEDAKYAALLKGTRSPDQVRHKVLNYPLKYSPGSKFSYSNMGFSVAAMAAGRAAGEPFPSYLQHHLFGPLHMTRTGYDPRSRNCAPTSPDTDLRKILICTPQDRLARALGRYAGHAGPMTTSDDLGKLGAMYANNGVVDGTRLISQAAVAQVSTPQSRKVPYGLGAWTNAKLFYSKEMDRSTYGHFGYTGGGLYIDPTTKMWAATLTNTLFHRNGETNDGPKHAIVSGVNDTVARVRDSVASRAGRS